VCPKFSCVRSSHDLCERTHAHSLEGTLNMVAFYSSQNTFDVAHNFKHIPNNMLHYEFLNVE